MEKKIDPASAAATTASVAVAAAWTRASRTNGPTGARGLLGTGLAEPGAGLAGLGLAQSYGGLGPSEVTGSW